MYLEQHWLIYFFRQFLPCEHWHGFGTRANPPGRSSHPLIFAQFVFYNGFTDSWSCNSALCVWVFAEENESVALAGQSSHLTQGFVLCLLSLGGKSKMLRNAALCHGLAWIPMAANERDFYFSVTAIKLVWLYEVFRKFVVRSLIVQPCLVFSCALGMKDLSLTLPLNLASSLLWFF